MWHFFLVIKSIEVLNVYLIPLLQIIMELMQKI